MQAIILLLGGVVSVAAVLVRVPGHAGAVIGQAHQEHKLSLGQAGWSWQQRTIPTVLAYSVVHYLTKFITFQDAVQRYLAVPSQKVSLATFCCCLVLYHAAVHCTRCAFGPAPLTYMQQCQLVHALIKFVHEAMYVSACSSYNISTRIYHHVRTRQCGTDLCFLAAKIPLSTISARKARFILVTKAVMTSKHCFSLNEAELGYIAV